jgi:hypothetical protein
MRSAVGCFLLTIRNRLAERIFHYGTGLLRSTLEGSSYRPVVATLAWSNVACTKLIDEPMD